MSVARERKLQQTAARRFLTASEREHQKTAAAVRVDINQLCGVDKMSAVSLAASSLQGREAKRCGGPPAAEPAPVRRQSV